MKVDPQNGREILSYFQKQNIMLKEKVYISYA